MYLNSKGIVISVDTADPEDFTPLFYDNDTYQFRVLFDINRSNKKENLVLIPLEDELVDDYDNNIHTIKEWFGVGEVVKKGYNKFSI
jgi:hypothetical protein